MKIMKKTLAVIFCSCVLLTMTSCSSVESEYKKAGAKWAIEAYKELPAEFNEDTCNQFWIGGDVFEFPMKASEFADKGWEIIDIYKEDVDWNYLLDPSYEYELCLKKDGAGFMTWIYNDSDEPLPVSKCMVIYIKINYNEEALLPGGALLNKRYKTLDEALAVFNKDMTAFSDKENSYGYWFEDSYWGENCSVRIQYSHNPDDYSVAYIEYFALAPQEILK